MELFNGYAVIKDKEGTLKVQGMEISPDEVESLMILHRLAVDFKDLRLRQIIERDPLTAIGVVREIGSFIVAHPDAEVFFGSKGSDFYMEARTADKRCVVEVNRSSI